MSNINDLELVTKSYLKKFGDKCKKLFQGRKGILPEFGNSLAIFSLSVPDNLTSVFIDGTVHGVIEGAVTINGELKSFLIIIDCYAEASRYSALYMGDPSADLYIKINYSTDKVYIGFLYGYINYINGSFHKSTEDVQNNIKIDSIEVVPFEEMPEDFTMSSNLISIQAEVVNNNAYVDFKIRSKNPNTGITEINQYLPGVMFNSIEKSYTAHLLDHNINIVARGSDLVTNSTVSPINTNSSSNQQIFVELKDRGINPDLTYTRVKVNSKGIVTQGFTTDESVPTATTDTFGTIKLGSPRDNDKELPLKHDNKGAYVDVSSLVHRYSVMPDANSDCENIIQYVGESTDAYTKGYFYSRETVVNDVKIYDNSENENDNLILTPLHIYDEDFLTYVSNWPVREKYYLVANNSNLSTLDTIVCSVFDGNMKYLGKSLTLNNLIYYGLLFKYNVSSGADLPRNFTMILEIVDSSYSWKLINVLPLGVLATDISNFTTFDIDQHGDLYAINPETEERINLGHVVGPAGGGTGDGTTFTPTVTEDGNLSWTNDGGLDNPLTVNIKGPQGEAGTKWFITSTRPLVVNTAGFLGYELLYMYNSLFYPSDIDVDDIREFDLLLVNSTEIFLCIPVVNPFALEFDVSDILTADKVFYYVGSIKGADGNNGGGTTYTAGEGITINNNTISTSYMYLNNLNVKITDKDHNDRIALNNDTTITLTGNTTVNGSVTATNGFYDTSDISKKDIISDISLDKCYSLLDKCLTIVYTLKDLTKEQIGLIALEVEEFFPEVISTDDDGYKSLDYSKLVVICLKLIKDVVKRLEQLENGTKLDNNN